MKKRKPRGMKGVALDGGVRDSLSREMPLDRAPDDKSQPARGLGEDCAMQKEQ